jgi:ATP-dependent DNA helicase RecQ
MQLPLNLEAYFQEAGRAGRNGKTAYSFLLINQSDIKRNKDILKFRYPTLEEIQEMYQKIADYLQVAVNTMPEEEFAFNIEVFAKKYNFNTAQTYHALQFLENEDLIKLLDNSFGSSKIKMAINNSELYKFQIANSFFEFHKNYIKKIPRNF